MKRVGDQTKIVSKVTHITFIRWLWQFNIFFDCNKTFIYRLVKVIVRK